MKDRGPLGSDSSMVDENGDNRQAGWPDIMFRFLYGRWKREGESIVPIIKTSSDSSMVDENP